MNSYIKTSTSLTYKSLLKNMFIIIIYINVIKILDLRNKVSFGYYQFLTKDNKILA